MLDTILEFIKKILVSRLFPVALVFILLFCILVHRLFVLQVVRSDEIESKSSNEHTEIRELKSTRGNIYDVKGNILAYNELSYSVTMVDTGEYESNEQMNKEIYKVIRIIETYGGDLILDFDIALDEDERLVFTTEGTQLLNFKRDAYSLSSVAELSKAQESVSAKDLFEFLRYDNGVDSPRFEISDEYSMEDALKIMTIRFHLFMNRYKIQKEYVPITIATNIDMRAVAAIEENSDLMHGVEVVEETHRVYNESEYFAHILGYTGTISSEQLEEKKISGDNSYSASDQIGKMGIEAVFDEELRGKKGYTKVKVNENSKILETLDHSEPVAGNDITLTIDTDLQKACYLLLEKQIAGILLSKIVDSTDHGTKGESADGILIPIYDVYFNLFKSNVIHIDEISNDASSDLEKQVYRKFLDKQDEIFRSMDVLLSYNSKTVNSEASEEMRDFLDYVYSFVVEKEILLRDKVDKTDPMSIDYANDKISLSEFLQYALSQRWIDLDKLSIGDEYYSSEELYKKLLEYIKKLLKNNSTFTKKIYNYLIYSYKLTGKEICLLLFDQGVLEYNEGEVAALENETISAYDFITGKIRKLKITPGQLGLQPCSGTIVVTDVKTGKVKAMVSYPSYDNNKLANSIDADYYADLVDKDSEAYPMMNRSTQQKMAPGSTFKMITAVASLEEGILEESETVMDKVVYEEIKPPPSCWNHSGHGRVSVSEALGVSCNYFFYEMGHRLGTDSQGKYDSEIGLEKLKKYAGMFGLSDLSGVEVSEVEPGNSTEDAVRSAIGQGSNAYAPIQLSRYVTTIANTGKCYNLTLIDKISDCTGKTIKENEAGLLSEVDIRTSTWNRIHNGMYQVVYGPKSSYTSLFDDLKVKVAGKTGTAQIRDDEPNHALFVSYAPYENPEISVTVVIPNGYSSASAAELASNVYRYYYDKESKEELLTEEATQPTVSVVGD